MLSLAQSLKSNGVLPSNTHELTFWERVLHIHDPLQDQGEAAVVLDIIGLSNGYSQKSITCRCHSWGLEICNPADNRTENWQLFEMLSLSTHHLFQKHRRKQYIFKEHRDLRFLTQGSMEKA